MKRTYNLTNESDIKPIVADYLKKKSRTDYYAVTYRRYFYDETGCDDFTPEFLKCFTAEQMALVEELVAVCKEEGIDLYEAMGEDEKYNFLHQGVDGGHWYLLPESVDLEKIYHRYGFKYGYFLESIEEQPRIFDMKLELTDEEYETLLVWRVKHQNVGFTSLRHDHPALYEKLATRFDRVFALMDEIPPHYAPTYVVEMTEVNNDAKAILAAHKEETNE